MLRSRARLAADRAASADVIPPPCADGSVLPYGDVPNLGGAKGRIFGSAIGFAGRFKPL